MAFKLLKARYRDGSKMAFRYAMQRRQGRFQGRSDANVLGKRAGHASERVKIPPTLTSTIDYTSKIGDIGKKQVAL